MKKSCKTCEGSGQISYFKGVSRFLLSWEECPECAGLGYIIDADGDDAAKGESNNHSSKADKKKQE